MLIRHTRFLTALALTLSTSALTGCGSTDDDPGKNTTPVAPAYDFGAFDAALSQFLVEKNLKGASIVLVHKDYGVVHSKGYGEYDANRLYVIASSSKVLSVGVLMRLADQGKLNIDAPIGNVLGAWQGNKPELTTAQLLSNSSGLVGLIDNPLYGPYICQYVDSVTLDSCAQAIYKGDGENPADPADRKPPDTTFRYGGGQWQLAGGIAQVAGGKPWKDLIRETYVDPCGTSSLGYTNQYTKASSSGGVAGALSYPTFFDGDPSTLPVSENPSIEGGAYITAQDYAKILLMHLRGGVCETGQRVLSEAAVARMQEDRIGKVYGGSALGGATTGVTEGQGYGLGWWVERAEPGVVTDAGAYGAMPWIDNPRGYAGFIALQSDAGTGTVLRTEVKPLADAAFDAFDGN